MGDRRVLFEQALARGAPHGDRASDERPSSSPGELHSSGARRRRIPTSRYWTDTHKSILRERDEGLAKLSQPKIKLDGNLFPDVTGLLRATHVYAISLEPGSFIRSNEPDNRLLRRDSVQVASGGWWRRIAPLSPCKHELALSARSGGRAVDLTLHITIGGK